MNSRAQLLVGVVVALIIGVAIGYAIAPGGQGQAATSAPATTSTPATTQPYTYPATTTGASMTPCKEANYTVNIAYNEKVGFYLVDSRGRTLYFFAKDYDGKSHCYGECAQKWPVFYAENLVLPLGLNPDDFGVITRDDGTKQLTYKGWPLYYFFKDTKPGDINGDGVKGVWFVAKPDYTVMVAVKEGLGAYLVDAYGRTLYFFAKDTEGNSTCYGQCAQKWPPMAPKPSNAIVIPSTLNITDFQVIMRNDGTLQLVYKGHPLYYWINDKARGDTNGHGVKDVWYVANIKGELP